MSTLNKVIVDFLNQTSSKFEILNYLYNLKNDNFDSDSQSVYYSGPYWDEKEVSAAIESFLSGKWLVSGESVRKFERLFSKKFNHNFSVMVNSGSSANLVMIAAIKKYFKWPDNSEVIVSPVGFPTTIAPLLQNNLTPVFVDIDMSDLNFDLCHVESKITEQTKAIFVSPVLGNPPDMDKLVSLSRKNNIEIILDNCDSLGSKWKGKNLSSYAIASSCSFYPAHHVTTGEGGMVSSDIKDIVDIARSFAWWGRDCYCVGSANLLSNGTCKKRFGKWIPNNNTIVDHKYVFSNIGYNLKPLDFQGAIGVEQLHKFDEIHKKRVKNKKIISDIFTKNINGITIVEEDKRSDTSWFGVPIICKTPELKKSLVEHLEKNKVQTRNYFAGNILLHPAYMHLGNYKLYPNANLVLERVFFVGCSPTYNNDIISYIEEVVKKY